MNEKRLASAECFLAWRGIGSSSFSSIRSILPFNDEYWSAWLRSEDNKYYPQKLKSDPVFVVQAI
jgi:hypothetical protein